jgi:hypothetical protein
MDLERTEDLVVLDGLVASEASEDSVVLDSLVIAAAGATRFRF